MPLVLIGNTVSYSSSKLSASYVSLSSTSDVLCTMTKEPLSILWLKLMWLLSNMKVTRHDNKL